MELIKQIPIDIWIAFVTVIVNITLAQISKKYTKISTKIIPLQTMFVGLIVCGIEYLITRDFNYAVAISGIVSGGTYDLGKAFKMLFAKKEEE